MSVYYVKGSNDETEPFDCGIASTEEKAKDMVKKLEEFFEDAFEFKYTEQALDVLILSQGKNETILSF